MKIQLNDVRLSFAQALFEPQQVQGQGNKKFSASFIFPPNHPAVAQIKEAFRKISEEAWPGKAAETFATLKAGGKLCMRDGDEKPQYDGYKGNLFLNASNKSRPLVIDGNKSPLQADSGKPYSGCYVNAVVELWAQGPDKKPSTFGKRINASLLGVQFLRDGARLSGGGVASADDFQAIPDAVGADAPASAGTTAGNPDPFA